MTTTTVTTADLESLAAVLCVSARDYAAANARYSAAFDKWRDAVTGREFSLGHQSPSWTEHGVEELCRLSNVAKWAMERAAIAYGVACEAAETAAAAPTEAPEPIATSETVS